MSKKSKQNSEIINDNLLFSKIAGLIELARKTVATAVNLTMVHTYFEVGRMIVEDEQQGKERAEYGKTVLKDLSIRLNERFGRGFSEQNLRNMRQFFLVYADRQIRQTPSSELKNEDNLIHSNYETPSRILQNKENEQISIQQTPSSELKNAKKTKDTIQQTPSSELQITENTINSIQQTPSAKSPAFTLGWSHYLILMRIDNPQERSFYEIEATKQNWSERQLKRQYHSSLYERLALSRNKDEVMKLANEGHTIEKPEDILKNPLSLEFLGLEEKATYSENDMEHAIISKLQNFLLELGNGFLFEARQKRFTFDEKHFYVDLVFYNRLLQCYVLIDLKTDELVHQDLGQMQMYVNYFDRYVKLEHEKPSIGILLCKKKNNAIVELTLPKDANIYASEYSLYLPDKLLLQQKLTEWMLEFEIEAEVGR